MALVSSSGRTLAEGGPGGRASTDVPGNSAEAQSRYEEGVRAYAAGRYADAIDLFRDADRRAPSAALSFNMAHAYTQLNDDAGALGSYREYLRRAESPDDKAEIERKVELLSLRLAARGIQQLTVLSTPPGATVFLDGERIGVTPSTSETKPGAHKLTVSLEGYEKENRQLRVPVNEAIDVRVALHEQASAPPPLPPVASFRAQPRKAPATQAQLDQSGPSRPLRTVGIIALGAGGAALGGAVAFELLRRDAETKAKGEQEQVALANELDTVHSRRTAVRVLAGVGAGLAAIGGGLFFLSPAHPSSEDRGPKVKVDVAATGLTAVVSGRF